jgi:hypothetical protein
MQSQTPLSNQQDPEIEPESYSLDQMMERLKERGHEEGELVTRADGSQAVKIKKRKRRSEQPHKEAAKRQQKIRLFQLGLAFSLFCGLVATAAGLLFYYNSTGYRESIRTKIEQWTGADVDITEFSVTPNTARCATMNLSWPAGNHLRTLQITRPSAQLNILGFLTNQWGGNAVVATNGKLIFGKGQEDAPKSAPTNEKPSAFPFSFDNYRIEKLDVIGFDQAQQPWLTISGTEVSLVKTDAGSQTRFVGGKVNVLAFQPMHLDRASIDFTTGQMIIDQARFKPEPNASGSLELSNNIDLYGAKTTDLNLSMKHFPLEILLGEGVETIMSGFVDTNPEALNCLLRFTPGSYDSYNIQLGFVGSSLTPLTLCGFPFFSDLSRELQDQDYVNRFHFADRVEGELIRDAKVLTLRSLHLEKKGQFIIKGDISVTDGKIVGQLDVGLQGSLLTQNHINPMMLDLFARNTGGYQWCKITLGGTPTSPADNFNDQIKAILDKSPDKPTASPTDSAPLNVEDELDAQ